MENKEIVLVTGSSTGFGLLTSQKLAKQGGFMVFASMRNVKGKNAEHAENLKTWAKTEKANLKILELDVTRDDSVNKALEELYCETDGRLDVLINNAGITLTGITEAATLDDARMVFDVNFFGVQRMNRAVLPQMRKRGKGCILHVSSIIGRLAFPFFSTYCASKFALEALAEAYHYELRKFGVDSLIVEPGGYPTAIFANAHFASDKARAEEYGPLGQMPAGILQNLEESMKGNDAPNPDEVAEAIEQLLRLPSEKRPLRTVVPANENVEKINELAESGVRPIVQGMGLI